MKRASRLERGFGLPCITLATACTVLAGCGGSSGTPPPDNAARAQAATATAQNHSNCSAIRPFYWEIGNQSSALASGSIDLAGSPGAATYTATTAMPIASASKWLYGAYVAQKRAGVLSAQDITHLHFTSGYTNFNLCAQTDTIKSCLDRGNNGLYSPGTDGKFFYNGGHMQKHASLMGLDAMDDAALAIEVGGQLGITVAYSQPQPAGGVYSNASTYAVYLRKLLNGQLQMNQLLGSSPVCTSTDTACGAGSTPSPPTEHWHYSIGHWVEDDPTVGDGAFSSAGAFGFYPWIDATKTYYGVLARDGGAGTGMDSVMCGRLIRKAWVTGTAQQG